MLARRLITVTTSVSLDIDVGLAAVRLVPSWIPKPGEKERKSGPNVGRPLPPIVGLLFAPPQSGSGDRYHVPYLSLSLPI
jgi:hypothetical protein